MSTTSTPAGDAAGPGRAQGATLAAALDAAAAASTEAGLSFHDARGGPVETLPFARLAAEAREAGARMLGLGLAPGDRVGIVAETEGDFARAFLGAVLAGLLPCPMPLPAAFGVAGVYAAQIGRIAEVADVSAVFLPDACRALAADALEPRRLRHFGPYAALDAAPESRLPGPPDPDALAYLQFSSGTTRAPRGVGVTHRALMANLAGMAEALAIGEGDRGMSWLPFYHDMGLVGCLLLPIATGMPIDYLATRDFIRRPGLWTAMIGRARATLSYAPSFGYELAARRARPAADLDLSSWRIAGVGGDMVRKANLDAFAAAHALHGFDPRAFLPSYGMAELALGLTFPPTGRGCLVETPDPEALERGEARPGGGRAFARCGTPLPGHEVEIRDAEGRPLPGGRVGRIHARGPSVMKGYFRDPDATAEALGPGGWLDTGDTGYLVEGELVVTGRAKDLILVNGRNIWPQDIEWTLERGLEGLREGGVAAFALDDGSDERVVVALETRALDPDAAGRLREAADALVRQSFGLAAEIALTRPGTLPRTSSGKLSRAQAREMHRAGRLGA